MKTLEQLRDEALAIAKRVGKAELRRDIVKVMVRPGVTLREVTDFIFADMQADMRAAGDDVGVELVQGHRDKLYRS